MEIRRGKALTEPQQRAFDWLPKDGSWRMQEKGIGPALDALRRYAEYGCVECEGGSFGPRGGFAVRWRLTENWRESIGACAVSNITGDKA